MSDYERKLNCWEFMGCGREPGGDHEKDCGVCPASTESRLEGVHCGRNGGRACWVVAGTLCLGDVDGTFAKKFRVCSMCDFYQLVREEESSDGFIPTFRLLDMVRDKDH